MFSVLLASLISYTYTDRNSPLTWWLTKNIPSLKLFPNRVPIELSQIAFTIKVLPEVDRTDFIQEERLGLPYWTMILAICALVDVSKYLNILTLAACPPHPGSLGVTSGAAALTCPCVGLTVHRAVSVRRSTTGW